MSVNTSGRALRVAIIGYGKMGREIERVLVSRGHEVALIVDAENASDLNLENMREVDVAIEFTAPEAARENIMKCLEMGVPIVCGTTAWTAHIPEIEKLCRERNGAFFYASNYSIGVNVVMELNSRLAAMMNRFAEYDVTVEETHHVEKKDAPSGTAVVLADDIVAALDRKTRWIPGVGTGAVNSSELEVASIRRGVAPGTHVVTYESPVDAIVLSHNIKSRVGLASGAVAAAEFLAGEVTAGRRGVYTMKNLLKLWRTC